MTLFQLLMLGASAFFAFKIYEHVQTLKDPEEGQPQQGNDEISNERSAEAFSTFDSSSLIEKADEQRENNNLEKALAIYAEANIKEPKNAETLFKMGFTLALQERDEEALEYFLESIDVDADNPFTYLELAKIYRKIGDDSNADIYEQKARDLDETI